RAPAPVAVLVGGGTASSAEVLALTLRARAGTRSFGAPTRGLSAGNRTFPLSDGASLVLTVAATSDAAGQVLLGPLVPDELVPAGGATRGTASGNDAPLDAAVAWLTARDSCR
ncbi:MAG: peptidase S41, partial [Lysobacterales bacterium]